MKEIDTQIILVYYLYISDSGVAGCPGDAAGVVLVPGHVDVALHAPGHAPAVLHNPVTLQILSDIITNIITRERGAGQ